MTSDKNSIDPIDGYDLRQYRNAVAKYLKLMIRARAKSEPNFLTPVEYSRWHLSKIAADQQTAEELLRMAKAAHDHLWRDFIGPHGSGGVHPDGPRGEVKGAVVSYTTNDPHLKALESLRYSK